MCRYGQKKRRDIEWAYDPYCRYCGVLMSYPTGHEPPPLHMLTLEHLDNKLSGNRGLYTEKQEPRTIIVCWECNQYKGMLDQMAYREKHGIVSEVKKSQKTLDNRP